MTHGRLIDADALMADCQLAQKQADRHGREFANAFYSGGGEISTEWWCVEDMIENAPTIEERKKGKWRYSRNISSISYSDMMITCDQCGYTKERSHGDVFNFCPSCGADMRGDI